MQQVLTSLPRAAKRQQENDESTNARTTKPKMEGANKKIGPVKSRKHVVRKVTDLTPLGQIIYKVYKKAMQQYVMLKRAKRALKFSKTVAYEKLCNNMKPYAKKIIEMQMNLSIKKKVIGFLCKKKLIALSILKQIPKGHQFLRKIFILPSKSTLNRMVSKLNIQTGICPQVF
ncbi:hypothetical protein ACJJTC_014950 [Scirpophaga incertulas]